MGSSLPDLGQIGAQRDFEGICDKHGPFKGKSLKLFEGWLDSKCELCLQEQEARQKAEQEEREKEQRRRASDYQRDYNFRNADIPLRYQDKTLLNFLTASDLQQKALGACKEYATNFAEHYKNGASLILCGNAGTGKTHLACAMIDYVIREHGKSAKYTTASKIFRAVKNTYSRGSDESEDEVIKRFANFDLLVVDEVGVQFGSDTEKNILFEVINERYSALRPTILISNLSLNPLREYAGDRVIDRMKENGGKLLVLDWSSHRNSQSIKD